jgi:hypothetical protein
MIKIPESTKMQGGCDLVCECGNSVHFVIHWDFIEGTCKCGKQYCIKIAENLWNCCSGAENASLYQPEGKKKLHQINRMNLNRRVI